MKTIRKSNNKYIGDIQKIISEHIKLNLKDYLILSIIFTIGIMVGVMLINNSDASSKTEINGYINSFINTIKNDGFEINKIELVKITILENIKLVLIIWIAGTTIIGIPLIYLVIAYKGLRIGYTVSAIMITLGNWKGLLFSILALFLQNIIIIPILLMLNLSSIKLYRTLIKKDKASNIKEELIRHTMLCLILLIPIIIASFISSFISSDLLLYFVKNL